MKSRGNAKNSQKINILIVWQLAELFLSFLRNSQNSQKFSRFLFRYIAQNSAIFSPYCTMSIHSPLCTYCTMDSHSRIFGSITLHLVTYNPKIGSFYPKIVREIRSPTNKSTWKRNLNTYYPADIAQSHGKMWKYRSTSLEHTIIV